jgi:D-3-phosphoglycerate dehydrogenase
LGYGRIGGQVAGFGKAFGMQVLVWSRERGIAAAKVDGYCTEARRDALFEQADVLTLHLRLVPETRGIVTVADLARMKPSALLVNTGRAGLIEEGALGAALNAGRPGFAAVDVYEEEPLVGAKHPLLTMDHAICTPHLGYVERDQLEAYLCQQFERVLAFAAGKPIDVVNPQVLGS